MLLVVRLGRGEGAPVPWGWSEGEVGRFLWGAFPVLLVDWGWGEERGMGRDSSGLVRGLSGVLSQGGASGKRRRQGWTGKNEE